MASLEKSNIIHRKVIPGSFRLKEKGSYFISKNLGVFGEKNKYKLTSWRRCVILTPEYIQNYTEKQFYNCVGFIAPECFENTNIIPNFKQDMFSVGVLFYRLIADKYPFGTSSNENT